MKTSEKKKRPLWHYILILLALLGLGFILGFGTGRLGRHLKDSGLDLSAAVQGIYPALYYIIPALLAALLLLEAAYCILSIRRAGKIFAAWDGEDEAVIQSAERRLDGAAGASNVVFILLLFFFTLWAVCEQSLHGDKFSPLSIPMLGLVLVGLALNIVLQRAAVQVEKRLNPEKRGELLDLHFQKDWMESCDEAQRRMIGEAAYKAVQAASAACMVLWLLCLMGILLLDTGPAPVTVVTVIWLTLVITYQREGCRLEYGGGRTQAR